MQADNYSKNIGLRQQFCQQVALGNDLGLDPQALGFDNVLELAQGGLEVVIHDDEIGFRVVGDFSNCLVHALLDNLFLVPAAQGQTLPKGFPGRRQDEYRNAVGSLALDLSGALPGWL